MGGYQFNISISLKVLKGVNLFEDLMKVFFKVLRMRFLKFYVRALFLSFTYAFF